MNKFSSKWLQNSPETPRYEGLKSGKKAFETIATPIVVRSAEKTEPSQRPIGATLSSSKVGDGPPPDRPPQTEQELRRLIDHLADPEAFTRWIDWAMSYTDPAEEP